MARYHRLSVTSQDSQQPYNKKVLSDTTDFIREGCLQLHRTSNTPDPSGVVPGST